MVLLNPLSKYGTFGLNLNFPKENHSSEFGKSERPTQVDSSQYSEFISQKAFGGFSPRPRNAWQANSWAYSLSPLALGACNNKSEKPASKSVEDQGCLTTSYLETVEIQGNPEVGTIYFIRDMHEGKNDDDEAKLLVTDSYFEIIRFFLQGEMPNIFSRKVPLKISLPIICRIKGKSVRI